MGSDVNLRRAGRVVALVALAAIAVSCSASSANAQERTDPPAAAAASDTVHLLDGGLYRGRIVEIVPGDHVTIIVEGGESKSIPWSNIDRVVAAGSPSEPPIVIPTTPESAPSTVATPFTPVAPITAEAPSGERAPRPQWRHNRTLVWTGTFMFAAGYAPVAAVALPSTAGLAGRVALIFLTLGLACLDSGSGSFCRADLGALQLLIPVVGPVLFASNHPRDYFVNKSGAELSGLEKGLLYASAGVQAAGLVTLVSGLVFGRYERVDQRSPAKSDAAKKTVEPSFFLRPLEAPGALGLSVGAYRW